MESPILSGDRRPPHGLASPTAPPRHPRADASRPVRAREVALMRASTPWNGVTGRRGRPRKDRADEERGCIWPVEGRRAGVCGDRLAEGLTLCPEHGKVLDRPPGATCAWPGCEQTTPFRPLCSYHMKRALGLLGPFRA
jgi:hypothetical protein